MKILKNTSKLLPSDLTTCITVGTFDGIHRGHDAILSFLKNVSTRNNLKSLVFTFNKHPRYVLKNDEKLLKLLNTPKEKAIILQSKAVDYLYIQDFTKEFYLMPAPEFIKKILIDKLHMKALLIGHDHSFGKDRAGDFSLLNKLSREYNFSVYQLPAVNDSGFAISSTKIRNLLGDGDLALANEMLAYNYSFSGKVVQGRGIGRDLGFPTANILADNPDKLLPAPGVYIIKADFGEAIHEGILNIGSRPTFDGNEQHVEAHIFSFKGNLYNKEIKIEFLLRIRDEMKFATIDDLIKQLHLDKEKALQYFGRVC